MTTTQAGTAAIEQEMLASIAFAHTLSFPCEKDKQAGRQCKFSLNIIQAS